MESSVLLSLSVSCCQSDLIKVTPGSSSTSGVAELIFQLRPCAVGSYLLPMPGSLQCRILTN